MKIILEDKNATFEQQLKNSISIISNAIVFDITFDGKSQMLLSSLNETKYILAFSRPVIFNILRPPLAEFEFLFTFKRVQENTIAVEGTVRVKKYIVAAILFLCMIVLFKLYSIAYRGHPFDSIFLIIMPAVVVLYFAIEYFVFRKKIRKVLNSFIN